MTLLGPHPGQGMVAGTLDPARQHALDCHDIENSARAPTSAAGGRRPLGEAVLALVLGQAGCLTLTLCQRRPLDEAVLALVLGQAGRLTLTLCQRRPLGEAVLALVLGQAGRVLANDAPGRAAWAHSGALAATQRAAETAPVGSELAEAVQVRSRSQHVKRSGSGQSFIIMRLAVERRAVVAAPLNSRRACPCMRAAASCTCAGHHATV